MAGNKKFFHLIIFIQSNFIIKPLADSINKIFFFDMQYIPSPPPLTQPLALSLSHASIWAIRLNTGSTKSLMSNSGKLPPPLHAGILSVSQRKTIHPITIFHHLSLTRTHAPTLVRPRNTMNSMK